MPPARAPAGAGAPAHQRLRRRTGSGRRRGCAGRSRRRRRLRHGLCERAAGPVERGALARLHGVQVVHHDDEGPGLLLRDQVVHDHVDLALRVPALLVLAPAVHEVQDRVPHLRVGVVVGRRVDVGPAPRAGHLRVVPALAHLPVRHVLQGVVRRVGFRHLDAAVVEARAEERAGGGVGHDRAVDRDRVVVEPDDLRRRRHVPEPVGLLGHVEARSEPHAHLLGVGRVHAEHDPAVGEDAGIRGVRDVERVRLAVGRGLGPGAG